MSQGEVRPDNVHRDELASYAAAGPNPVNEPRWGEKLVVPIVVALIAFGGVALGSYMANQQADKTTAQQIQAQAREAQASFSRTYRQGAYSAFISDNASLLTAQAKRAGAFKIPDEAKRLTQIAQSQSEVDLYASKVLADAELVRVIGSQDTIRWANQVLDEQNAYSEQYEVDSTGNGPARNPAADVASRIDGHTFEIARTKGRRDHSKAEGLALSPQKLARTWSWAVEIAPRPPSSLRAHQHLRVHRG